MGLQHGDETNSGINVHADERSPESAGTLSNNSNDVNCPLRLSPESNMEESTKSPHSTTSIEEPSTSSVVEGRATKREGRNKPVLIVVMVRPFFSLMVVMFEDYDVLLPPLFIAF